jgi:hypothetical protein
MRSCRLEAPVGVIECVVGIGAELKPEALMDAEGLCQCRIEVDVARTGEDISSRVAIGVERWHREGAAVYAVDQHAATTFSVDRAHSVWPLAGLFGIAWSWLMVTLTGRPVWMVTIPLSDHQPCEQKGSCLRRTESAIRSSPQSGAAHCRLNFRNPI